MTMHESPTQGSGILHSLGAIVLYRIQLAGHFTLFLAAGFYHIFSWPIQIRKILQQVYFIGAKSLLVIFLTALFTGMVLGLQGYYSLVSFGSEAFLGSAVALTLIRELGPVLTAIMVAARAGSAMTAEIGILRISEQVDALKTMNIHPVRYLFSPRLAAAIISIPLLASVFNVVGIIGGYLTGSKLLGVNPGVYFLRVESSILLSDVTGGLLKSLVFSIVVATVCCYQGYFTHRRKNSFGSKSVGLSTTSAVVQSSVLILITDYILTSILL
ncbi:phospholipid/cholesterol/gamma-HCH transport system permease protein [Desulfobotulus alkaliphilus]|uniref:Phospholipid/cholesterol/gamma-HCH transport system permease protein n=1 Tax=Desulfobotulus alkaliphilus TaxID=622671 RepID=A0A562RCZ0_9BACT|nr:ABC transporter permease [Desulfobotulus alkaliphilus]TWI66939.1 phospholipid/cholesterol/gamma-HCH transport system permease protein [Desulfobotulus alkaliphilus]